MIPRDPLPPFLQCWVCTPVFGFLCRFWGLNTGPCACQTNFTSFPSALMKPTSLALANLGQQRPQVLEYSQNFLRSHISELRRPHSDSEAGIVTRARLVVQFQCHSMYSSPPLRPRSTPHSPHRLPLRSSMDSLVCLPRFACIS